jgi:cellulose synthase/poly-beta-1,6-N-acetylglucosamine synthase-like glycosyltransferase
LRPRPRSSATNRPTGGCPTGLTLANLKIAEDRIPSLLAVFPVRREGQGAAPAGGFTTHWVRDAVCYFESEETLEMLCVQRRRWLNGTNMVRSSVHIWLARIFIDPLCPQDIWSAKCLN